MSKQKILSIAGVVLLVVLVIVAFSFMEKYDDAQALLEETQQDLSSQISAAETEIDELNKQLAEAQEQLAGLQAEAEAAKTTIDELTAGKEAAEKLAAELEAGGKEAAEKLAAEAEALKKAEEELASAKAALSESEAALKSMTNQYNSAKADLDAKITRYNIVRESHAKLAEKYDQLALDSKAAEEQLAAALEEKDELEARLKSCEAELEKATAEEVEYVEPERYESACGVSFVLPEGASIGNESSRMVEIILSDGARIKINVSTDRVNLLWYDADIEAVNALAETIQIS